MDLDEARGWLRDRLTGLAAGVYPETEPLVEDDAGPLPTEPVPDTEAAHYRCSITVTTGAARPPWDAPEAVTAAGRLLTADGWQPERLRHEGDRYEVVARRDGFVVVASMLATQGILRLVGSTPEYLRPPLEPAVPTPWQPANDVERAVQVALDRGDRENLLGLLKVAPLYLPAPYDLEDELPADDEAYEPTPWATMSEDDTVYLVVFTSPEAVARFMGEDAESFVQTTWTVLAENWPEPAWRLAVNPNGPLELLLPAPGE